VTGGLPMLTLWEPWATLIAVGAKTIETRSWAAPPGLIGERIGIHAGRTPRGLDLVRAASPYGRIGAYLLGAWAVDITHAEPCDCDLDEENLGDRCAKASGAAPGLLEDGGAFAAQLVAPLSPGCIVATATLAACLPMVDTGEEGAIRTLNIDCDDSLWIVEPQTDEQSDAAEELDQREVSNQRPYGDFARGRFAWLLEDVKRTTEHGGCPGCLLSPRCQACALRCDCTVCDGKGRIDPVPARGGQRVWRWRP
jgi:hypothetical protein